LQAKTYHERSEDASVTAESMVSLEGKRYQSNNDKNPGDQL